MGCHRLRHIRESCTAANAARLYIGPERQNGDMLARVIGAAKCRIIAMISRDDGEITGLQQGGECGQPRIKRLQCRRITGHVTPMAMFGIEINEVCESETTLGQRLRYIEQLIEQRIITGRLDFFAGMAMGENIANLAQSDNLATRLIGALL